MENRIIKQIEAGCRGGKGGCSLLDENDEKIYMIVINNKLYFIKVR